MWSNDGEWIHEKKREPKATDLNLTKLTQLIANEFGLEKAESSRILKFIFKKMRDSLNAGKRVTFQDLGTFQKVKRKARTVGHPRRKNELIELDAYNTIRFRPSRSLKDYLNRPR